MRMEMETAQPHPATWPIGSNVTPPQRHPILATLPSPTDAAATIFLNHPSARLSSSPASSPKIVVPSLGRRESVYPAMDRGLLPGADFFDDASSDSEWEDTEGERTQLFTACEGPTMRSLEHRISGTDRNSPRGRSRDRIIMTALPSFGGDAAHKPGLGIDYGQSDGELSSRPTGSQGPKRAKPMSMRRLNKDNVRLVDHRSSDSTTRGSVKSNDSNAGSPVTEVKKPFPFPSPAPSAGPTPLVPAFQSRHRRNTSDSMVADSIKHSHIMAMRALESLNLSPTASPLHPQGQNYLYSATSTDIAKSPSFCPSRNMTTSPWSTTDSDRPAHLPPYFVKTPYPFTARKEFPKPKSRPRQRGEGRDADNYARLKNGYDDEEINDAYDARKGKHVLGIATSDGEYDLRSRHEQNRSAQGLVRSHTGSESEGAESVVWLSLQKCTWKKEGQTSTKLVRINIPGNLAMSNEKNTTLYQNTDFDDTYLAHCLRDAHHELAGCWLRRVFSARKLRYIQLGQTSIWSGTCTQETSRTLSGLLAAGKGTLSPCDTRSPFTEQSLMTLYKKPKTGKARYTWVHWARRVAASNNRHASDKARCSFVSPPSEGNTTVRFVHGLSTFRILAGIVLMLLLSVAATVLWVFFGTSGGTWSSDVSEQRSGRVGSAMAIGVLALLLEGLGFGAWVAFS